MKTSANLGMTDRPPVSIITPCIPERLDLLVELMRHIREQTYPNLEHVVTFEGEPNAVDDVVTRVRRLAADIPCAVPTRVVGLGRWWTRELSDSYCSAPFMVGQFLARGAYACPWADDERALDPEHLSKMVALLETEGVDFVYPIVEVWWADRPDYHRLVWAERPTNGHITHWLYRPSMIEKAGGPYRTHVGRANDWEFIERAVAGGATWAFLPEITFQHRSDVPFT